MSSARRTRPRLLATAALGLALAASAAWAAPSSVQPLSPDDAQHYAAAFDAAARGDFIEAQIQSLAIHDAALAGYLSFDQLMHPKAHTATFEELSGWLGKFRDLPLADRIFSLAVKRKPAESLDPPAPLMSGFSARAAQASPSALTSRARQAREAFFAGDARRALPLAQRAGDRWIEGLAAFRLKAYDQAAQAFHDLARDETAGAWTRSAAAFWNARADTAMGQAASALDDLRLAAQAPQTFYGMIAARELRRAKASADAVQAPQLLLASLPATPAGAVALVTADARAHRAAALAQIGHLQAAAEEIRAGLALARDDVERENWRTLGLALGAPSAVDGSATIAEADYPLPPLAPVAGFTLDKALVYAIVRQESRFDPMAMSSKGAIGLMQLTPEAAARAAGDDKLLDNMSPLFDGAFNLRVGQDYLSWLMDRAVGYDLVRVVAAYNGGPGMVQRTAQMLGEDASDPLMLMECLPPLETRNYVQKVLAGYWTYKTMFGEETQTLEALASGASTIDARLDLTETPRAAAQLSGQPLQPALR